MNLTWLSETVDPNDAGFKQVYLYCPSYKYQYFCKFTWHDIYIYVHGKKDNFGQHYVSINVGFR